MHDPYVGDPGDEQPDTRTDRAVIRDAHNGLDPWPRRRPVAIVPHVDYQRRRLYLLDASDGDRLLFLPIDIVCTLAEALAVFGFGGDA